MYHFRSTPKITATRGCRADVAVWPASLLGGARGVGVGDGTAAKGVGEATSLRSAETGVVVGLG